jgi:hypothetical protein
LLAILYAIQVQSLKNSLESNDNGQKKVCRPGHERVFKLWDKWGQAYVRGVQSSALLQQGLPEAALEEWPQGILHRSREEATQRNEI